MKVLILVSLLSVQSEFVKCAKHLRSELTHMSHLRPTCRCHSGLNPVLLILGKDVSFGPSCNVCSCMNSYSTSILSSYRFIILAVRIFSLEGSRQVTYKPFLLQVSACGCVRLVGRMHRPLSWDSGRALPVSSGLPIWRTAVLSTPASSAAAMPAVPPKPTCAIVALSAQLCPCSCRRWNALSKCPINLR